MNQTELLSHNIPESLSDRIKNDIFYQLYSALSDYSLMSIDVIEEMEKIARLEEDARHDAFDEFMKRTKDLINNQSENESSDEVYI